MFTPISLGVEYFLLPINAGLGHGIWVGVTVCRFQTWLSRVFTCPLHSSHHCEKNMCEVEVLPRMTRGMWSRSEPNTHPGAKSPLSIDRSRARQQISACVTQTNSWPMD